MTDIYLGIDPGVQNCALVAFTPSRGMVLAWKPQEKHIPPGVRRLSYLIHTIKGQLDMAAKQGEVKQIAMEGYSMFEKFGQHQSGEVGGAIKLALVGWFGLHEEVAYPVIVAPQQLKKFVSGNGNTKKGMIPKEILKRWGMDFNDDNLAEAYGLARVAYAVHAHPEMPAFQQDVVKALHGRTEWTPERRRLLRRPVVATGG